MAYHDDGGVWQPPRTGQVFAQNGELGQPWQPVVVSQHPQRQRADVDLRPFAVRDLLAFEGDHTADSGRIALRGIQVLAQRAELTEVMFQLFELSNPGVVTDTWVTARLDFEELITEARLP